MLFLRNVINWNMWDLFLNMFFLGESIFTKRKRVCVWEMGNVSQPPAFERKLVEVGIGPGLNSQPRRPPNPWFTLSVEARAARPSLGTGLSVSEEP